METEMESQLRGVSSSQPQLFAEIAQCHDLRALPEQHNFKYSNLSQYMHSPPSLSASHFTGHQTILLILTFKPSHMKNGYCQNKVDIRQSRLDKLTI
jgi:hypothetical protein